MAGPVGEWCSGADRPRCERRRAPPQAFRRDATATSLGIRDVSTCGRHGHCEAVFWATVRRSRAGPRGPRDLRPCGRGQARQCALVGRGSASGPADAPASAERPRPASSGGPRAQGRTTLSAVTWCQPGDPGRRAAARGKPACAAQDPSNRGQPRWATLEKPAPEPPRETDMRLSTVVLGSGRRCAPAACPAPTGPGPAAGGPRTRHREYNEAVRSRQGRTPGTDGMELLPCTDPARPSHTPVQRTAIVRTPLTRCPGRGRISSPCQP